MCLSSYTIKLFHHKAIENYGGDSGILSEEGIDTLEEYIELTAEMYGWGNIETICLAVYQLIKGHYFIDANKRTANYVLLNCLRRLGFLYTGREKDLVNKIIELAATDASQKEESVLDLAYFLRSRLQKRTV